MQGALLRRAATLAATTALMAVAAGAALASPGRTGPDAARCAVQRVDSGRQAGRMTVRLVLVGQVTCAEAHRAIGTYFNRMKTGRCGRLNNFCALSIPGGWSCSIFSAGVSATAGGAMLGCARPQPRARIRVFKVSGGR